MVRILTDSAADFSEELARQLNVEVLPLGVTFEDGMAYRDRVDLQPEEFYEKLAACEKLPKTSQPNLGDVLTAFPSILLALVVISLLGPGKTENVIIALGLVFIPSFARVTRGAYAGLRDVNYVKSARLMGASSGRILWRHILPNTWSVLLPALTIGFNNAVLAEASMSYLCIGVTPPDASLGYMLSESQGMFVSAPWYALGTGLTLVWMIFGVGLIGEGLQRRNGGDV